MLKHEIEEKRNREFVDAALKELGIIDFPHQNLTRDGKIFFYIKMNEYIDNIPGVISSSWKVHSEIVEGLKEEEEIHLKTFDDQCKLMLVTDKVAYHRILKQTAKEVETSKRENEQIHRRRRSDNGGLNMWIIVVAVIGIISTLLML